MDHPIDTPLQLSETEDALMVLLRAAAKERLVSDGISNPTESALSVKRFRSIDLTLGERKFDTQPTMFRVLGKSSGATCNVSGDYSKFEHQMLLFEKSNATSLHIEYAVCTLDDQPIQFFLSNEVGSEAEFISYIISNVSFHHLYLHITITRFYRGNWSDVTNVVGVRNMEIACVDLVFSFGYDTTTGRDVLLQMPKVDKLRVQSADSSLIVCQSPNEYKYVHFVVIGSIASSLNAGRFERQSIPNGFCLIDRETNSILKATYCLPNYEIELGKMNEQGEITCTKVEWCRS